ncbi:hypothetical protein DFJ73DRAFT_831097 [Zopfochytrium polystomum]|nr:hypothetical protein DFJ73DRAFT_831097 [Zopfochytrium polystomum]
MAPAAAPMDIDKDVTVYLQTSRSSAPTQALKDAFTKMEELYDKKLWHQLTVLLESFVDDPAAAPYFVPLYDEFIVDFAKRINQLRLVQYVTKAARTLNDPAKSLAFIQIQVDRLKDAKDNKDAYVLAVMEAAYLKLTLGNLESCKDDLDRCEKILDELPGTEPSINASFYRVAADYYKAKALYPQYYHNALLFLSSVSLEDLSAAEKLERAHDLALSALLGEGLYNFGELLMHPILDVLQNTKFDWLRKFLFCFNSGDNEGYEKITKSAEFKTEPLLVKSVAFLSQKLCLMTLMESVFRRSKEERGKLPFAAISKDTRVAVNEVEHLVMKALSLGLVRGSIDEIDQCVNITWVQPRVLDVSQIRLLKQRLSEWSIAVKKRVVSLENGEESNDVFLTV